MPEANDAIDVCREITEITISVDRKINMGNYESSGVFVSAKVVVPRNADPAVLADGLSNWIRGRVDIEVAKITGKEPEKKPEDKPVEKVEDKKEVPPAGAGAGASGGAGAGEPPLCKYHNKPMLRSKWPKPGREWWCPEKSAEGDKCKYVA